MDAIETNIGSLGESKKKKVDLKTWSKSFFTKKNIISLVVISIILMTLTQLSLSFGYRMGMIDSVKKQSQVNF